MAIGNMKVDHNTGASWFALPPFRVNSGEGAQAFHTGTDRTVQERTDLAQGLKPAKSV